MKRSVLSLYEIKVNDENPRFEPVEDEQKAIEAIISMNESQIFNLCNHINKNGLNPTEVISVMKLMDGHYVTLDGNRRVVAMKLLQNPGLTSKHGRLAEKIRNLKPKRVINEILFSVFDNKEEAELWIELKHTGVNEGVGTVPWSPIQRERFKSGSYHYALSLLEHLQSYKGKYTYEEARRIDVSSLQRVLGDPYVRQRMGIKREGQTLLFNDSSADKNVDLLLDEMLDDAFTVDKIRRKDDRKIFIECILGVDKVVPKAEKGTGSPPKRLSQKTKKQIPATTTRKTLIPNSFVINTKVPKINDLILELKKIDVHEFPITVGIALRTLIELMLNEYCSKFVDSFDPVSAKFTNRIDSVKKSLLQHLDNDVSLKKILSKKDLNRIVDDTLRGVSILHGYVHSEHLVLTPTEWNAKWNSLSKVFELMYHVLDNC